jgi:2-polyprenyl-3-methyl-5-hydroxy-6-metoxy-1,4-benzoquinol methylase
MTILKGLARTLAFSPLFASARTLWEHNRRDWHLPLSKFEKFSVGAHLILRDYAEGFFPPLFPDESKAHDAEINLKFSLPGYDPQDVADDSMRKPFQCGPSLPRALRKFMGLVDSMQQLGIRPPQRILELGCGYGWMSEALALMRFEVLGTSISPHEIVDAQLRLPALQAKGLSVKLEYRAAPMESVDQAVADRMPFDAVFVCGALHHAYDWRAAIQASRRCLKGGGWLIIANEPNVLHTLISYRVAKLAHTHEVGMSYAELSGCLRQTGFRKIRRMRNRLSFFVRHHWLAAQK